MPHQLWLVPLIRASSRLWVDSHSLLTLWRNWQMSLSAHLASYTWYPIVTHEICSPFGTPWFNNIFTANAMSIASAISKCSTNGQREANCTAFSFTMSSPVIQPTWKKHNSTMRNYHCFLGEHLAETLFGWRVCHFCFGLVLGDSKNCWNFVNQWVTSCFLSGAMAKP